VHRCQPAEIGTVLTRKGRDTAEILDGVRAQVDVEPLTEDDALGVAALYPHTAAKGLSLGDRACLSLAQRLNLPAVSAEGIWAEPSLDITVCLVRGVPGGE
jgi:PIN domain nuclease of toxin-antitoxin system